LAFSKSGFLADVRHGFDAAQFINGLRVVGDRAEAVHGDDDRPHREEAERHQAKGENGRGELELRGHELVVQGRVLRKHIGREHQRDDAQSHPERAEVAGDEAGQDVQRRAALAGGGDDFFHVPGIGAHENLRELHDERAGERAAGNNAGEHPPEIRVGGAVGTGKIAEQQFAGDERGDDGNDGGQPHQVRQRLFPVEILFALENRVAREFIRVEGGERSKHHHALNRKNPDDELGADNRRNGGQGEADKRDQGHARHAVGFKTVRRRANGIARVVTGAIGDDAGVFRVVFRQVENNFHQIGTDVGNLGEDAAADAQRRRAEGFADGKADETGAGQVRRYE